MTLFDRYIAVDWSAANERRAGKDSIWVAERGPEGLRLSLNPPTRAEATALLIERIRAAREAGERVMVGFDFVFGYPRGAARAIAGKPGWRALWDAIGAAVLDSGENKSNRFEVASSFNRTLELAHFWGHPPHHRYADLQPTRPLHDYIHIAEHRLAESYARGPQPVWKLSGVGSVGSQTLLGIPRLLDLKAEFPEARVWPFETAFESELGPLALVEIYPSMFAMPGKTEPKDREQVEVSVTRFAELDAAGLLGEFLSAPGVLLASQKRDVLEEEGWIAGVGHEHLLRIPARSHVREPRLTDASSFQHAAARLRWPVQHLVALSLHARPAELIHPHVTPGNRILALTTDPTTAPHVAKLLVDRGYGRSLVTVLENLGGKDERIAAAEARAFDLTPGDFYVLAVDCVADPGAALLPPVPGLPDEVFVTDGRLTTREIRAITLGKLAPYPGALLWDVGAGCGSIAIEWMRAARDASAIAFEREGELLQMIAVNAANLGTPLLRIENGDAPGSLIGMPTPDAIFLGGAVSNETLFHACWTALRPGGRFVANATTIEDEQALYERHARLGGELMRLDVTVLDSAAPRPRAPVTQWAATKP